MVEITGRWEYVETLDLAAKKVAKEHQVHPTELLDLHTLLWQEAARPASWR
jgi:hypothetical protein